VGLIQRAEIAERLRRAFNLQAAEGIGTTISPEIVPVVLVEDVTGPTVGEGYPHKSFGYQIVTASALVFSENMILNPINASVDLIVEEVWLWRTAAVGVIDIRKVLVVNIGAAFLRRYARNADLRLQPETNVQMWYRQQAAVLAGNYIMEALNVPITGAPLILPLNATVPPGVILEFVPDVVNEGCNLMWFGYERVRRG